jgi:hypothetical protein
VGGGVIHIAARLAARTPLSAGPQARQHAGVNALLPGALTCQAIRNYDPGIYCSVGSVRTLEGR